MVEPVVTIVNIAALAFLLMLALPGRRGHTAGTEIV